MSSGVAQLNCETSNRRAVLRKETHATGIDFVEVTGQGEIILHLLHPRSTLAQSNVEIQEVSDGQEIDDITVERINDSTWKIMGLEAASQQTTARYQLSLRNLALVDPLHAETEFSVAPAGQPLTTDEDPLRKKECPPAPSREPEINYLARDFQSLRQVMLDRLALIMPDWKERHAADLGMTLVELLAYLGDHLSYYQDAVATEAYLGTARSRISVKRHARLVDYNLHEGCNARTFLQLEVARDTSYRPENVYFITQPINPELQDKTVLSHDDLEFEPPGSYLGFETVATPISCRTIEKWHCMDWEGFAVRFLCDGGLREAALKLRNKLGTRLSRGELMYQVVDPAVYDELLALIRETAEITPIWGLIKKTNPTLQLRKATLNAIYETSPGQLPQLNRLFLQLAYPDCFCFARSVTDRPRPINQGADDDLIFSELQPQSVKLFAAHNEIRFYTWNQEDCCIPAGATSATLLDDRSRPERTGSQRDPKCATQPAPRDQWLKLRAGDFLLLKEVQGAVTGNPADADPKKRQVVRLTSVCYTADPVTGTAIVEVQWAHEDRLTFPLCVSSTSPTGMQFEDVSIACGNIILADHGIRIQDPLQLGHVPPATNGGCSNSGCSNKGPKSSTKRNTRVGFTLPDTAELTYSQPVEDDLPANGLRIQKAHQCVPELDVVGLPVHPTAPKIHADQPRASLFDLDELETPIAAASAVMGLPDEAVGAVLDLLPSKVDDIVTQLRNPQQRSNVKRCNCLTLVQQLRKSLHWQPRNSLVDSRAEDQHVAVEIDEQRRAHLRFGNGHEGRRPAPETQFFASYREGNGTVGNIGQDKLKVVVYRDSPVSGILSITNPLPAAGGTDPETIEHAKVHAPHAFRKLDRAILTDDYRQLVMRDFARQVQQVRIVSRPLGLRTGITVVVDFFHGVQKQNDWLKKIGCRLRRYARIGHYVIVRPAEMKDVTVTVAVTLKPGFLIGDVRDALLRILGTGTSLDGQKGFFHPDNLTFGDGIRSSRIIGLAMGVPGVADVSVDLDESPKPLKPAASSVTTGTAIENAAHDPAASIGGSNPAANSSPDDEFTDKVRTFGDTEIPRVTLRIVQEGP